MEFQGIRIKFVILAFLLVFALLFGGQMVYQKIGYNQPVRQILEEHPGIESYEIDDEAPVARIAVKLERTDNLMDDYQQLDRRLWVANAGRPYELVVQDERSAALNDALHKSQFSVYQAIIQGNFPEMVQVIESNAREAGAEAKVFVDNRNVYIQMDTADHYLMSVVPRTIGTDGSDGQTGGGLYAQGG